MINSDYWNNQYKKVNELFFETQKYGGIKMSKKNSNKKLLKQIRTGIRLKTKAPKVETPKSVYSRNIKHRRRLDEASSLITRLL